MNTRRFWMVVLPIALVIGLVFAGCNGGSDGSDGKSAYEIAVDNGFTGSEEEWLASLGGSSAPGEGSWFNEYCISCHRVDGSMHQASYDQLYQDGVIEVSTPAYANTGGNDVVTFEMTKFGNPFDCTEVENMSIYFTPYTGSNFELTTGRLSIEGTVSYMDSTNVCTSTIAESALGDLSLMDGLVVVYGRDEQIATIPGTRVSQSRYPYAAVVELGTVDYTSAANNAGCEKCHTVPFLKHGYILADTVGLADDDFYTCKACHLDDGDGGHFMWQLLVDDPQLIITLEEQYGEDWEESGDPRLDAYAYKTSLMNDVHMSHAMEFPYPQSMSNCATCHDGKLDLALANANFTLETCKSCHPISGDPQNIMDAPALLDVMPTAPGLFDHSTYDDTVTCTVCHTGLATPPAEPTPSLVQIHTGYNPLIYTDALDGTQIGDEITVSIDSASYVGDTLTVTFSASGTATAGGIALDSVDIVPTVLVGLYGRDTKDYLIGPHARDVDGDRNLELTLGSSNPRVAFTDTTGPTWAFTADLSAWTHLIGTGNDITKAEIAVMPDLDVALDAVSESFDLVGNNFIVPVADIVRIDTGCNNCHDALNTTFHLSSGVPRGRGGSIEVCRLCHISLSGGSHLEMQSRSIDSYVHAIHSFQPFDIGDIDFDDPVEELHYEHHIGFVYPTLGFDCESCHNEGTFDVPDQEGSMPGLLSASDDVDDRNIGDVPEYVTGPATRACGACHRTQRINADDAAGLTELNQHFEDYGYLWENDDNDVILGYIVDVVFSIFP